MTLTQEPAQANPAYNIAVTRFTVPDLCIGAVPVALSQCGLRFIELLSRRFAAYNPPHFVPVDLPQPWPNNNVVSGFIDVPVTVPGPGGSYLFQFPIYLQSGELGDDDELIIDAHNLTVEATISAPPTDPGALFDTLAPAIGAAFDTLVEKFANSPNFSNYMWGSSIVAVDATTPRVTVGAGSLHNLQPGNLLQVLRRQGTPAVFEPIAVVQVTSVTDQSSRCTYFGSASQEIQIGDLVSKYQGSDLGRGRRHFLARRRFSALKQTASGSLLPVELGLSINFPDGMSAAQVGLDPSTMVGPPQLDKSFLVDYISVFARVPEGQQVHVMINGGNAGGHWISLAPQGSFDGYSVYVGSQLASFVISPVGFRMVAAVRSASVGTGIVDVHLTGSFGT